MTVQQLNACYIEQYGFHDSINYFEVVYGCICIARLAWNRFLSHRLKYISLRIIGSLEWRYA